MRYELTDHELQSLCPMDETDYAAENCKLKAGASNGDARGKPLTPAERSRAYRARKRGRKRQGVTAVTRVTQATVSKAVTPTVTKTVTATPTLAVTDVARVPQPLAQVAPQSAPQPKRGKF